MIQIKGNLIDLQQRSIYPAEIKIIDGLIESIVRIDEIVSNYILPGFIDAHIHIESSMVVPYEFARVAMTHGTVATISDPHEIANVLGVKGVRYMIENARDAKLKFHFGAPSCVPATDFETSGAVINSDEIEDLMVSDDIFYLSEMMNYPGVLGNDSEISKKLKAALASGKPIDGHAPGLRGQEAREYIAAGISTDHECFTLDEAIEKLSYGMKILIREGSAAKNFEALHPLIHSDPEKIMFCSDDKHPDDLILGHINDLVKRSLAKGYDLFDVLRIACVHPVEHYKMNVGLLRKGDPADFIIVDDVQEMNVVQTFINGDLVADDGHSFLPTKPIGTPNQFNIGHVQPDEFLTPSRAAQASMICAIDGELITEHKEVTLKLTDGILHCDPDRDILKIAVVNRYHKAAVATAFIQGFGIKNGAIASSVAHDSHNIVVVGTDANKMCKACNLIIENKGGLSAVNDLESSVLPLPIAGLMSDLDCKSVATAYSKLDQFVKTMGSTLTSPFMTLSFMALLVIPKIKLSDKGLFDAENFRFITAT